MDYEAQTDHYGKTAPDTRIEHDRKMNHDGKTGHDDNTEYDADGFPMVTRYELVTPFENHMSPQALARYEKWASPVP